MDPQRYARVKEVFREAMRWAPEERVAVVAELAGDDAGLRDEVMSLLAHHDDAPLIREPAPNVVRLAGVATAKEEAASGSGAPAAVETAAPAPATHEAPGAGAAGSGGRTLAELLRAERAEGAAAGWPIERVIRTLDPIVRALATAADRGEVHGAIRVDHVLLVEVGGESVAELADPGAAGTDPGPRGTDTATRLESAEAGSAAPEQISPTLGPVGPWTDVYGLALLCVELMLGRPAVKGTAVAVLARVRDETAQPTPRAVGLEVPAAVEAVMAMALAMRPMERYQDVRRFWTALRESLAASRSPAPSPLSSSSSSLSSRLPTAKASTSRLPKLRRRARGKVAAAGLVIAAVVAAAAIAVSRCG